MQHFNERPRFADRAEALVISVGHDDEVRATAALRWGLKPELLAGVWCGVGLRLFGLCKRTSLASYDRTISEGYVNLLSFQLN
jgi:hypothetical protein